ncbi:MAG: GAF domain-containing protein [Chloroflexota bacterium]
MKILYVEDEIAHVELTQRTLEENLQDRFILIHTESLRAALKIIETESDIDLVLTDLRLPDGSGLDLLKTVQKLPSPPAVVLVTGQGDQEVAVAALKAGAADYLVKQSDYLHRLPVVISNAVAQNRLAREQAALREAQARFRTLVEQIPAAVYTDLADQHNTRDYVSPQIEEISGYTPQEWLEVPDFIKTIVHPEDRVKFIEADEFTNQTGEPFNLEYRILRKDGLIRTIHDMATLAHDASGKPIYWQGILFDISKERESQETIKASERSYRGLFNSITQAIYIQDKEGRFVDVNDGAIRIYDYPREFFIGKTPEFLSAPGTNDLKDLKARITRAFLGEVQEFEFWGIRSNGEVFPKDVSLNKGTYFGQEVIIAIEQDITARKRAEAVLEFQVKELTALHAVATAEAESLSEDEIIGKVTIAISQIYSEVCGILLLDQSGNTLTPHPSYFGADISGWQNGYPVTEGISGKAVLTGKIIRIGDVAKESGYIEIAAKIASELCVPVRVQEHVIGVINIESKIQDKFNEHDESFLTTIASGLGTTLEKLRLFNEEQRRANEFSALYATTSKLTTKWDLQSLLEIVLSQAMELLASTGGGIYLYDAARNDLVVAVARGLIMHPGIRLQMGEGMAGRVAQSRQPLIVNDYQSWQNRSDQYTNLPIRAVIEVPMQYGGELIGVLAVLESNDSIRKFTEADTRLLSLFATQAASAIKNAHLFESEKQRRKDAETLRETTNKLTSSVKLDELFEIVLDSLKKLVPYDSASIEMFHQDHCEIVAGHGIPENLIGKRYQIDINKWGDKEITRQPVILYDVQADKRFEKFEGTEYIHGWMGIPLLTQDKLIGFLNLDSRTPGFYTDEFASLAQTFGNQAAIAIEKARLFQEQIRRSEIIETLANVANEIATTREVIPALEKITQQALDLLNANHVAIFLLQDDTTTLKAVTAHGRYRKELLSHTQNIKDGITGRVLINGKPEIVNELSKDLHRVQVPGTPAEDAKTETLMSAPLILHGKAIGVINAWRLIENGLFNETELNFLVSIANQASICIESGRLFQETKRQAQEAAAIAEVGRDVSSTLQLNVALERIASYAKSLLHAETSAVFLADKDNVTLHAVAAIGLDAEAIKKDLLTMGRGILGNIATQNFGEFVNDTAKDPRGVTIKGTDEAVPHEHIMGVPILFSDKLTGLLAVWRTGVDQEFFASELEFATRLAQQAAIALENARLYQEALRASERRAVLHRISQDIIRFTQDTEQIYQSIHEAAEQLMPCDVFMISLRNKTNDENIYPYTLEGGVRYTLENESANEGLPGKVINEGKSVILADELTIDSEGLPRFGSPKRVRSALSVPMHIGNRIIGMISAQSYELGSYGSEEQSLLEMLAAHAATAIENTRLYDETQRRLRELEIINRVTTSLRLAQSVDAMLPILLNEALLLVRTTNGSIWLYDSYNNLLLQRIASGTDAKLSQTSLKPGEGIVGYVFTTGEKYISSELKADPLLSDGNKASMTSGLSGICIPIQSTVGPVGVLIAALEMNRQITEEINLLTILAEVTGNAIHRAELFAQSQEQIRKLTTLRDIDAAIASSTDLRVTLGILMDHTLKHLKTDAVDIMLYHSELQSLTYLASAGFNNPSPSRPLMRLGDGLAGQVVMKGGIEHVADLRLSNEVKRDPMLIREGFITYFGIPLIVKGQIKGVFEIFHRSIFTPTSEWTQFLQTLAGQAAIAIDNAQLFDHLQRSNQEVTQAYDTTLEGWARALELRDRETEGHTRRVTELTMQLARYMEISEDELVNIYRGVLLHDIGKMGVPDHILRKTGPLIESEWEEMRKHPEYAFNLLAPIPYLRPALDIPYCHHEHWDGSGYPRSLKGEQIPLSARLFSIVDIWDALLSDRSYRKAWPEAKVINYLKEISGTILDPKVVSVFFEMLGISE